MKTFPVQYDSVRDRSRRTALAVPWQIGVQAWEQYAKRYGQMQSAERIAERGGFGESEMDEYAPGWRDHIVTT